MCVSPTLLWFPHLLPKLYFIGYLLQKLTFSFTCLFIFSVGMQGNTMLLLCHCVIGCIPKKNYLHLVDTWLTFIAFTLIFEGYNFTITLLLYYIEICIHTLTQNVFLGFKQESAIEPGQNYTIKVCFLFVAHYFWYGHSFDHFGALKPCVRRCSTVKRYLHSWET